MALEDRPQTPDLIEWEALARNVARAGPFAVLRHVEAREGDRPRLGRARRPELSLVDLAQEPSLGFAAGALAGFEWHKGRPKLRGYWLGLTGPMGPLPTHITEAAFYERQFSDKHPLGDWLDLLAGRMLQLFYRAWAESQPAAQADRPADDRFSDWLAALSGAFEGATEEGGFFARARVHYAAVFAGARSAVALQDALTHLLGQPARVVEYVPKWRTFEPEDFGRIGQQFATLGSDAVLGRRVYSAADAFRVIVRAQNFADYRSLMPGGSRFAIAAQAIDAFKPTHLEWDLCVEIADVQAPPIRLDGRSQLGWTSWLKRRGPASPRVRPTIRNDAHLRKTSLKQGKTAQ